MSAQRLVIFADPRSFVSNAIGTAVIDACEHRPDISVVAVCDTSRGPAGHFSASRVLAEAVTKRLFDNAHPIVVHRPMWRPLSRRADRAGIPVVVPDERNINQPEFISRLRRDFRPDIALSVFCTQIFRDELLSSFGMAVNYHNGLLPGYRGLRATGWSLYHGEPRTGFSFHYMTRKIDAGHVLHADAVRVRPGASPLLLEWEKTMLGAAAVPRVLDAIARDDDGIPQTGPAGYYSLRDCVRITTIENPSVVTWHELTRRLRAFGAVDMTLAGVSHRVTKVEWTQSAGGSLTFRTADAMTGRATRLGHLPPTLHRLHRRLRGRRLEPS